MHNWLWLLWYCFIIYNASIKAIYVLSEFKSRFGLNMICIIANSISECYVLATKSDLWGQKVKSIQNFKHTFPLDIVVLLIYGWYLNLPFSFCYFSFSDHLPPDFHLSSDQPKNYIQDPEEVHHRLLNDLDFFEVLLDWMKIEAAVWSLICKIFHKNILKDNL